MGIRGIPNVPHGLRGRGGYNVSFQLDGDWVKFTDLYNNQPMILTMAARQSQKEFAEKYRDEVKKNMRNGGIKFGYPPHSPKYERLKLRVGGPAQLFIWAGNLINNVIVREKKNGMFWEVGIPKGISRNPYYKGDKARLQVHEYANVIERGSPPEIPSRPIFRDTFREIGGLKTLRRIIETGIISKFGKRRIRVIKI